MADTLIIPPIRTSLEDVNTRPAGSESPVTEKSWYLYWQRSGDQLNANTNKLNKLVTDGTHANRPPAINMPDGALYTETDRSVIYQNDNGVWKYLAGTMFGTLNPDQRPTDLGVNDAGFDFRSTDTDPLYGARQFLWSQSAWIEVTPVLYGTHAARPAAVGAPARCLYIETDRSNVIYQNQNGVWYYIAGTMWNTIVPDNRPTDLGVHDAGFDYRTTDAPPRQFLWSGTVWIETTGLLDPTTTKGDLIVRSATAPTRLGAGTNGQVLTINAGAPLGVDWEIPPGGSGSTSGVSSVFGRTGAVTAQPGDYYAGQIAYAVDQSASYANPAWITSLAWSKITGAPSAGGDVQYALSSAALVLTTASQTLPGTLLSLNRAGSYLITGVYDFSLNGAGDSGQTLIGLLMAGGAIQGPVATFCGANTGINPRGTVAQQWLYVSPSVGTSISLLAYKTGGSGTSSANGTHSNISAVWIKP